MKVLADLRIFQWISCNKVNVPTLEPKENGTVLSTGLCIEKGTGVMIWTADQDV